MSVVPARLPLIAAAAALLAGGCVSAFTDGAGDWTPADGKPTCNPAVGVALDAVILAAGIYLTSTLDDGGLGYSSGGFVVRSAPAVALVGGGTIGVIGGGYKMYTCNKAKGTWQRVIRD